jgi:hypothetical protein
LRPRPRTNAKTSTAATENQTVGDVPEADSTVNAAMPTMEPMMSMAYARSGGMLFSSGPSGSARLAVRATTRPATIGRIKKF